MREEEEAKRAQEASITDQNIEFLVAFEQGCAEFVDRLKIRQVQGRQGCRAAHIPNGVVDFFDGVAGKAEVTRYLELDACLIGMKTPFKMRAFDMSEVGEGANIISVGTLHKSIGAAINLQPDMSVRAQGDYGEVETSPRMPE